MNLIKDNIKKSEISWKQLHTLIIRSLSGYQTYSKLDIDESRGISVETVRLFTVIRFQIQMISVGSIMPKTELSEENNIKLSNFNDALSKNLAKNLLVYFKRSEDETSNDIKSRVSNIQKSITQDNANYYYIQQDIDPVELSMLKDRRLDLYWLEAVSITPDQVLKIKNRKLNDSTRSLNIKLMMSMNNAKKSYKEFSDFVQSFGAYYERYFLENESQDDTMELIRNFGRLICLFCKGFSVPGRQKVEDLRDTYMYLFKHFRLNHIIPKICQLLRDNSEASIFASLEQKGIKAEVRVLIFNLYKLITFAMLALDIEKIVFIYFFRILLYFAKQVYSNMELFRLNRLIHLLMHKPSMSTSNSDSHSSHLALFEYDIKLIMCNTVINLVKGAINASEPSLKMAEKELLQLYRCLYYSIKAIDSSVHEGETQAIIQKVPDYTIIPAIDSLQGCNESMTPAEAQLLFEMLNHFFFSHFEINLGPMLKEKLDSTCRPKPGIQAGQNKKQVIDLNLPSKLKKSLQRVTSICFDDLEKNKDQWLTFPEAKALYKIYPEILNYRSKSLKADIDHDLNQGEPTKLENHTQMMKEIFKKAAGISEIPISDENLEIIYYRLIKSKESKQQLFSEYISLEGDKIEVERMKSFFKSMLGLSQSLIRSECYTLRKPTDTKLTQNGVSTLLNLVMYFYDQENTGKFLVDGINLMCETPEKLNNIAMELFSYEGIGILSMCCSGMMVSPLWFFYSHINLVKLYTEQFTMYQSLNVSRYFSLETSNRIKSSPELSDFYSSDVRATTLIKASLQTFFDEFKRYTTAVDKSKMADGDDRDKVNRSHEQDTRSLFDSVVVAELYEYLLINTIIRYEGSQFELNVLDLVDASIQSCQQIHSDLKQYIVECLKQTRPEYIDHIKDNMCAARERQYMPYKRLFDSIVSDNHNMASRLLENFNMVYESKDIFSYRIDFLVLMYHDKLTSNTVSIERIDNLMTRFGRLEAVMERECGGRNIMNHLYLNAFQITSNYHSHEIELLRNEVYLNETHKCLTSMLALISNDKKQSILADLATPQNCQISIDSHTISEHISDELVNGYVYTVSSITNSLKELIDVNPIALEKFSNFGIDHEKLFTFGNFVQAIIDHSSTAEAIKLSDAYQSGSRDTMRRDVDVTATVARCIEDSFKVVMKALHTLYINYEKHKYKCKDNHHFLRTAVVLKSYAELYFGNSRSKQMCDRFAEYLCEEYFTKCIDVIYKQDTDLKLSYVINNPMYKNNLRYSYFDFLPKQELQNIRTFKKIERIAFKESNPLYLIMAFKSMESNLQELFKKFSAASKRELNIIKGDHFGRDLEAVSRLINDNDEYGFFTSDKRHYDMKTQKSLMTYAKSTTKTKVFDLISIYISEIYGAICQCYTFCRRKKINLAKRFEESCFGNINVDTEPEVISLLEDKPVGTEETIAHLNKLLESLSKVHEKSELYPICSAFKSEYIEEFSKVLVLALSQNDQSSSIQLGSVQMQTSAIVIPDTIKAKGKKKSQSQTIDVEDVS